jgi:hypothetical protein
MKRAIPYLIFAVLLITQNLAAEPASLQAENKIDPALQPVAKWFNAWELVCRDIYGIDVIRPVEFVFFDKKNVYSTSIIYVSTGEIIEGPSLFGKKAAWKKSPHDGKIILPDNQTVPVGLMSFASPLSGEGKNAFFVMPLPAFWDSAGVRSKELGLDNLVTGVFLHEFAHSQQMQNFGVRMTMYEKDKLFVGLNFTDDIIQDIFETDSVYNAAFREETALFYAAANTKGKKRVSAVKLAMTMLESRQQEYFTGERLLLKEVDDFFLTMEGVGQYTMYAWLIHPRGGNIEAKDALAGVRRGKKSWSQEEGLPLFLVLELFSKPTQWGKLMFGTETVSVVELINEQLH